MFYIYNMIYILVDTSPVGKRARVLGSVHFRPVRDLSLSLLA